MAVIALGMTGLQLAQLVEALIGGAASAIKIHNELQSGGHDMTKSLPVGHFAQVLAGLLPLHEKMGALQFAEYVAGPGPGG